MSEHHNEQVALPRPWCRDCGPGYRMGDEGCRHDNHGFYGKPEGPVEGETAICRTCALPIVYEVGQVGHREVLGWSDRVARGGDSVVCFKAVAYRHVPMGDREHAIYQAGFRAGQEAPVNRAQAEVANAFVGWSAVNEIAEPPLDWSWFGEIARRYSPLHEEHDALRIRPGGGSDD